MGPSVETISRLLGFLYEAAASPEHWPEFFGALREAARADMAYFLLVDSANRCNLSLNYGFDPKAEKAYAEYFNQQDIVYDSVISAKQRHGEWIGTRQSVLSDAEFERSLIYNEFAKPLGMFYQCAAALGGLASGLEGGLGMMRGTRSEPFGEETIGLLAVLAPHMTRALNTHRLMSQLRSHNAELRESVEVLDLALVSVDGKGRVLRMTAAARAILDARDGLSLEDGSLRAASSLERARLQELVAGAAATGQGQGADFAVRRDATTAPQAGSGSLWTPHPGGAMLISRTPPGRPLQVVVTPFHSSEILMDERPAALVFLRDPDAKPASRAAVLRALYGLTPTEARLADWLVQGRDVAATADQMGITFETARFHLKTIFRKTGTSRQPDLVRLILGLPGVR